MNKEMKLEEAEKILFEMKVPFHAWDGANKKKVGDYTFSVENCGSGYIEYLITFKDKEIYHKNDGAGDYEYDEDFFGKQN